MASNLTTNKNFISHSDSDLNRAALVRQLIASSSSFTVDILFTIELHVYCV